MTIYSWLWIAWVAMFGIIETWAIVTKTNGGTLSEHLRRWCGVYPLRGWRVIGASLIVGFCIWLPLHLIVQVP